MGKIHIVQNDVIGCIAALKPFVGLWLPGLGRVCRERKRTVGRAMPTKRKPMTCDKSLRFAEWGGFEPPKRF